MSQRKRKQKEASKDPDPASAQPATTAFRAAEKKYKRYKSATQPVDLTDVIDFSNVQNNTAENQALIVPIEPPLGEETLGGRIFSIKGYEGFCFICNAFSFDEQLEWTEKCLREYTEPPNITNLNLHYGPISGIFEALCGDEIIHPSNGEDPYRAASTQPTAQGEKELPPKMVLLSKLRWATLGYQYNWTDRSYNPRDHVPFPPELAILNTRFAKAAGMDLEAEAAIVNFYSLEYDFEAPIVSISFGCSAIFLLGGTAKEDPPLAILIRSGDVMIMGGKSRLCYHGVPRILENTFAADECLSKAQKTENTEKLVAYLKNARINTNTRQVLKKGTTFPEEERK